MALTGKFLADFESFYSACAKAEGSLRSFDSGAGKVETSLNKVSDSSPVAGSSSKRAWLRKPSNGWAASPS
jgi:hypothetical protein